VKPGNSKTIDEITRILRTPSSEMSDEEQLLQVMKYLDNLIAWADKLFQQDTVESINEAMELYVLAASILGTPNSGAGARSELFGIGNIPSFCGPRSGKLLGYCDTVADRLFKIRHGMNMAGVVRPLAPFKSPVDLGRLLKAAEAKLPAAPPTAKRKPSKKKTKAQRRSPKSHSKSKRKS
jgi:hypothetical protein